MRTSIQACGTATTTLAWPKPSGARISTAASASGDLLADQVLAGDAEMGGAGGELVHDLGGRQEQHLHVRHARERAAVVPRPARLREDEPGAGEEGGRVLLQAALRGDGEDEGAARASPVPSRDRMRSSQNEQPTAGSGRRGAEMLRAGGRSARRRPAACRPPRRIVDLEDEAGVVVEVAGEGRREAKGEPRRGRAPP